jgi:hypothetical protein
MNKPSQSSMGLPGPPRSATGLVRYIILAAGIIWLFIYLRNSPLQDAWLPPSDIISESSEDVQIEAPIPEKSQPQSQPPQQEQIPQQSAPTSDSNAKHPIDDLVEVAEQTFQDLLKKESKDIKSAAAKYRERRGRHPPPHFDKWFAFAQKHSAIIVEEFFDQIYHDIGPFWGQSPAQMRRDASRYEMVIKIREGKASAGSDWFWTQIWLEMVKTIEADLPDMDLALNAMDEPRVLLPWEDINGFMEKERASRNMPAARDVVTKYQSYPNHPDENLQQRKLNWEKDRRFLLL